MKIVGCVEAYELTTCKQGANQHAHIILRKSMDAPPPKIPPTLSENSEMKPEEVAAQIAKSIMWNDVTKAYYAGMTKPEDQVAFMAKALDVQTKEAADAKALVDAKAAEAEAAKTAGASDIAKAIAENPVMKALHEQNEILKARLEESDIEKRANEEFAGFPADPVSGETGTQRVVKMLKAMKALPEADRLVQEGLLKSQIEMAKKMAVTAGHAHPIDATDARAVVVSKADEIAKAEKITPAEGMRKLLKSDPKAIVDGLAAENAAYQRSKAA